MSRLGCGFALMADPRHLELTTRIIEERADFYEISPETLWMPDGDAYALAPHGEVVSDIVRRSRRPCVAHGLGFSIGTPLEGDEARTSRWLDRIRVDAQEFGFAWYTEHLGFTSADGLHAVLPLPIGHDDESIAAVASRMAALRAIVPLVGVENQAWYFTLDDPAREPEFMARVCRRADCMLLLDLHNAYVQCLNFRLDYDDYLDRVDADTVLEIHISGGSALEGFRLDTHDAAVPEPVWRALENVLPRCRNLRGVVLERLDGTVREADVAPLEAEFNRMKDLWRTCVNSRPR